MGEVAGYDPGPWAGHDFGKTARKTYDDHGSRTYETAKRSNKTHLDLLPEQIICNAAASVAFFVDDTGSMGTRTNIIFDKAPVLDRLSKYYLGERGQILVGAIGDANNDEDYPLQARPYTTGTDLREKIKDLVLEGGGGKGFEETYELALLYALHNITFSNAGSKPVLILTGDEAFYDTISPAIARKYAHVNLQNPISTRSVYEELSQKCSVYMVRCRYGGRQEPEIHAKWQELLGANRVCLLQDPDRIVDVITGILAHETGKYEFFMEEITTRQTPEQVSEVMQVLEPIWQLDTGQHRLVGSGQTQHRGDSGPRTKRLLDDGG